MGVSPPKVVTPPDSKCATWRFWHLSCPLRHSFTSIRSRQRSMSTLRGCGWHLLHSYSSTGLNTHLYPYQASCLGLLMCFIHLCNSQWSWRGAFLIRLLPANLYARHWTKSPTWLSTLSRQLLFPFNHKEMEAYKVKSLAQGHMIMNCRARIPGPHLEEVWQMLAGVMNSWGLPAIWEGRMPRWRGHTSMGIAVNLPARIPII